MRETPLVCTSIATLGLVAAAALVTAGPINPPAGPVAPTLKTLAEVEPRTAVNATNTPGDADSLFRITQPGSYYLTGNITGVAGKHGVEIAASGVTLDLAGFDLAGVPGMGAFDGVNVSLGSLTNIAVTNGSVRDWGDGGVDLGFISFGCQVEAVLASGNAGIGINAGVTCVVSRCTANLNALSGIRASNGSAISACSTSSNSGSGIQVNHGCTITSCTGYLNAIGGIVGGSSCTVVDCSAYTNTGNGIQLAEAGSVTRCSTLSNTGAGVSVGNGSTVADCTADFNTLDGIKGTSGLTVSGCSTRSNLQNGINAGASCSVANCSSGFNSANGILVGAFGTIINCFTTANTLDGIQANGGCLIRGNSCSANGNGGDGAGIHTTTGSQSRIEDNNCSGNDRGIDVDSPRNIITRNTCTGNTINWALASGNAYGPIVTTPIGAAVNGSTAAAALGSTEPNANFSY